VTDKNLAIVKALLAAGANPNVVDSRGVTPLSKAIGKESVPIIKLLLDAKADPKAGKVDAPLFAAIRTGDTNLLMLILNAGADPSRIGTVSQFISRNTQYGEATLTPLRFAVLLDNKDAVSLLLKFKADLNALDDWSQRTPVLFDALHSQKMVKDLLEAGADANARAGDYGSNFNPAGETPLARAAREVWESEGVVAVAKLLLAHGAHVNLQDKDGRTALMQAAGTGKLELAKLLLENKADPNLIDNNSCAALSYAIMSDAHPQNGQPRTGPGSMVELLHQHGAVDDLPDWNTIKVGRASIKYSAVVFQKGTNDWNQFTLLELLGCEYGLLWTKNQGTWPPINETDMSFWNKNLCRFPDLSKVVIRRPSADGKNWTSKVVNVDDLLNAPNCSGDWLLKWGDRVEIPEADHPVTESWKDLPERVALIRCLTRTCTISIKGTNATVVLAPEYVLHRNTLGAYGYPSVSGVQASFMIRSVLDQSGLLRASSDLTKVKVVRHYAFGNQEEHVLDCSGKNPPDFWLKDGDTIMVPEKETEAKNSGIR
jgi:ankyrin repeat protein